MARRLILASKSPRRRMLLKQLGLVFETIGSDSVEKLNPRLKPGVRAEQLSAVKAQTVAGMYGDAVIIAADTIVVLDGEIIGKPVDKNDAYRILSRLSGREHIVITGYTVIDTRSGKSVTRSAESKVQFRKISDDEIKSYINTGEPLDKAGAYGMQERGVVFIEKVDGDPYNVVGLPLCMLMKDLKKFGIIPF